MLDSNRMQPPPDVFAYHAELRPDDVVLDFKGHEPSDCTPVRMAQTGAATRRDEDAATDASAACAPISLAAM